MKRVNEIIKEQKEMIKGNTFNFGFIELNSYLSYVKENGVITLFGYPAMGKTSFVLNIVNNISKYHKTSILYITTEEREEFLTNVLLSVDSSIPLRKIQKGTIKNKEIEQFENSIAVVSNYNLYIVEAFNKTSSNRTIEMSLREFFKEKDKDRKKIVIFDQYYHDPDVIERVRRYTKKNNSMLFILAPFVSDTPICNELALEDLDSYLRVISDCILSIYKPSYFVSKIDDNSIYINVLKKNEKSNVGEIKFKFDTNTLKYDEEFLIDDLPFELDLDFNEFDDIPF